MWHKPYMTGIDLTAHQIATIQTELRRMLGLEEERFSIPSFIGMVNDEIEQLRAKGRTDPEIAQLMAKASGIEIAAKDIEQHYASPEVRAEFHG